jgi:hypothetical protein
MVWAKRISKSIPAIGSNRSVYEINDYSLGFNSFISNDKFPLKNGSTNMWRLAQDARIVTLGEYETRKGFDYFSDAAGETKDQEITSTADAEDWSFNTVTRIAQQFTCGTTGRLSKVELNLKSNGATGTVIVELWSYSIDGPVTRLARTSIGNTSIAATYGYVTARFPDAPALTATTDYWLVVYVQTTGTGSYIWSSNSSATTAMVSTDSGVTFNGTSSCMNFKQYYAPVGGVKGLWRAYKSDGTKVALFVQGTVLYSVNNVTGALTAIKTGLSSSATHYRFKLINDIVYYVNGYDGLRKWDFTTESQVNSTNYYTIEHHKGLLFGARMDEPTRVDFSNFGDYETFASTDFVYAIGPKTGDPVRALVSLNGYLIMQTLNNKCILSGDDNATFSVDEAPDQKGTYTQETVTSDANFIYYLSDDGVYRSNGSEAQMLSENIYGDILALANKETCVLTINKGRLYLWFRSAGSAINDSCYVWNINYSSGSDTVESLDTKAYVSRAVSCFNDEDKLMVASSIIGQVYWQELDSNDYTNLGGDIDFDLKTHYFTFNSPSVLKEIRKWIPRFGGQSGNYEIKGDYAYDRRNNWTTQITSNVQGSGVVYGGGAEYGDGSTYGTSAETQESTYVPGEYRRIALRYHHYATRQPQKFLGHTLEVETRRLR